MWTDLDRVGMPPGLGGWHGATIVGAVATDRQNLGRRLALSVATAGVLLMVASVAAWVRSYSREDTIEYAAVDGRGVQSRLLRLQSSQGGIEFENFRTRIEPGVTPPPTYADTTPTPGWTWTAYPELKPAFTIEPLYHFQFFWMDNPYIPKSSGITDTRMYIDFPWWVPAVLGLMPALALLARRAILRRRSGGKGFPVGPSS